MPDLVPKGISDQAKLLLTGNRGTLDHDLFRGLIKGHGCGRQDQQA